MIEVSDPGSHKREQLATLLRLGTVLTQVDGRACSGLPEPFCNEHAVGLRLGYGLTPPIRDLELGEFGFTATLLFSGTFATVQVPWRALFGLAGEGSVTVRVVWPDDVPSPDVATQRPRPALRSV